MNPYDNQRTCGGSSGGDAGLVAARCIPMALGADIGGSIRIPCGLTGLVGFKPTAYRTSYHGMIVPTKDGICPQTKILPSAGPMAHSVDDCITMMKTFFRLEASVLDWNLPPIPFNEKLYEDTMTKTLTIGYFEDLPYLKGTDSVKRAV